MRLTTFALGVSLFVRSYTADVSQDEIVFSGAVTGTASANVRNGGTLYGARQQSFGGGAGTVADTIGLRAETGLIGGATGIAERAIGASIVVTAGAGTVQKGFGVIVADVPAVDDYAFYQESTNDTSYFAGTIVVGTPSGTATPAARSASAKMTLSDTAQVPRLLLSGTEFSSPRAARPIRQGTYVGAESDIRQTIVATLNVTSAEEATLQAYLEANNPYAQGAPTYDELKNSCVTVTENELTAAGILQNNPGQVVVDSAGNELQAGAAKSITPRGLLGQAESQGRVSSTTTVGTPPDESWVKSAFGAIVDRLF